MLFPPRSFIVSFLLLVDLVKKNILYILISDRINKYYTICEYSSVVVIVYFYRFFQIFHLSPLIYAFFSMFEQSS